jgi:selenocysteine-specific elongation factor
MYVIGTAGHVDHGKSTLVRALTGIDPDRLREEKERGLTIELGFAWLTLPSGREVSIVDVPGHERFIKNMLAGAGGVDLALLVVAADEGPMPQTREHLAILDLLDVPAGMVVITKCDLVEEGYAELVEAELEETLRGTRLAGARMVRTSASSGGGLDALRAAIDDALERTPSKRDLGRPRLPIDRAFTIQGFGTVVTGTLLDGALEIGTEVELQPGRLKARVRGLQRHKTRVSRLEPGTRAAVNLSGVHADEVSRGMVLAKPGSLASVYSVDVRLRATKLLSHPLQHDAGVTFLSATSESEARLRLLERDELLPGEEGWAQMMLSSPVAVANGDHCIVRTSNETVAGGRIVAINPKRHRRKDGGVVESLVRQLEGSVEERVLDTLLRGPTDAARLSALLGVEQAVVNDATAALLASGAAIEQQGRVMAQVWLESAVGRTTAAAEEYLAVNSLRFSAPREHVRQASGLDGPTFDMVVAEAVASGRMDNSGVGVAPRGYRPRLSPAQQATVDRFMAAITAGGYTPPTEELPEPALVSYLSAAGMVEDTGRGVVFAAPVFAEMLARTEAHLAANGTITLAEVRDLFGASRKYAQAFIEHLDANRITRRVGDARILREGGR